MIENQKNIELLLDGSVPHLSRAITLCESGLSDDKKKANELIQQIIGSTGSSVRVGVTGPPGVGKSTFINALGEELVKSGKKLAVLSIDPVSQITGGSLLADKTRMSQLIENDHVYIRPSIGGADEKGIARSTRQSILLCEAAGFDVVIVESAGIGQVEVSLRNLVDIMILLVQPEGGDELQAMKKGINELADVFVINKCDGELLNAALQSGRYYKSHFGNKEVFNCSSIENIGVNEVSEFLIELAPSKFLDLRKSQNNVWLRELIQNELIDYFLNRHDPESLIDKYLDLIEDKKIAPGVASQEIISKWLKSKG